MIMKVVVIGIGQFGSALALALTEDKHEVLALDKLEKPVDSIKDQVTQAVIADAEDRKVLEDLAVTDFDRICVMIGEDFAASLVITAHLQEMGAKNLYVRSVNSVQERILRLMRVEHIVQAETLAARQLAKQMGIRGASRHFELSDEFAIVELRVPSFLVGRTLAESDLRRRFGLNLVTVRQVATAGAILGVPHPELRFADGDDLVVFGTERALKEFSNRADD